MRCNRIGWPARAGRLGLCSRPMIEDRCDYPVGGYSLCYLSLRLKTEHQGIGLHAAGVPDQAGVWALASSQFQLAKKMGVRPAQLPQCPKPHSPPCPLPTLIIGLSAARVGARHAKGAPQEGTRARMGLAWRASSTAGPVLGRDVSPTRKRARRSSSGSGDPPEPASFASHPSSGMEVASQTPRASNARWPIDLTGDEVRCGVPPGVGASVGGHPGGGLAYRCAGAWRAMASAHGLHGFAWAHARAWPAWACSSFAA